MTIGQRIKQARKANYMSLRSLAQKAEISAMAISKYERDLDTPSSGVLLRLAEALDVSVDFLLRPNTVSVHLQAYRKHAALGVKEQEAIQMRIQEWLERYLEIESLFPDEKRSVNLPSYSIQTIEQVEDAALKLRENWNLGLDPIENLTQVLEDQGIKVGLVSGFEHFDSCTFMADGIPVIVSKAELPGDRQRFNLGHEVGHLILDLKEGIDPEPACHRFVGAFLVPTQVARFELGSRRTTLDMNELYLLKHKYGMSMQAWIFRAKDLGIISENAATRLFHRFRANGWHRQEPGEALPNEKPYRMERLIYRALAEDLISRSRAQELLGGPLQLHWMSEALQHHDIAIRSRH
ncbi:XRE family transcriptional regulator [Bellilinea sp.]|uniref:helix-turn-helix domain-containing protein n=1 Tax=Bellilinea sp. TaxID=2838785 RepID=UPI002ADD6005|nr:XRE family transcriptional regulator [Bellilinea sp.]